MAGSIGSQPVEAEIRRLIRIIGEVDQALRSQRELLRQRGMNLPPGSLDSLKAIQEDLAAVANHLVGDTVELEQLRALASTMALVNSSLDIDQVLNEVMDTVIALTGAERGYIVLRNESTGDMEFRIARNLDRETIDEASFIVSQSVVKEVARSGQPVVTTNALADPRFSTQESVMMHALRSILCVPLLVKGKITGVVYADNRIKDALFGEKELSLLIAFADQAAIAIENARLFNRVQVALAEITEIKELIDNIFASIASGVITVDMHNLVTIYNAAAEHILEIPAHEVLGQPLDNSLPIIYKPVQDVLGFVYQEGSREILEVDPLLPSRGEVNLTLKLTPLKNEETTEGVAIVVDDLTEIKRRDATLNVVRRYLPPAMVDNIQSLDGLALGGERRVITVVFVETRPFNSFPQNLRPAELMDMLNLYLTVGAEAIHHQTGVIDKFMGNEIMGLFNTQLNPNEDHAWAAILAALKMVDDFATFTERIGEPLIPYYRIGIHTGIATLGNVGSPTRREFTAIGDTVNLAKRLQQNAAYGQIIISEATCRQVLPVLSDPANGIAVWERGSIQVKGRSQMVQVYEIQRAARA